MRSHERELRRDRERRIAEQDRHAHDRERAEADRIGERIVIAVAAARAAAERSVRDEVRDAERDRRQALAQPCTPRRLASERERAPDRDRAERRLAAGEPDRKRDQAEPAAATTVGVERECPRGTRATDDDVTRRQPRVRLGVRGGEPEHGDAERRSRGWQDLAVQRGHTREQQREPGQRVQVVAERSVAEHAIVGGEQHAGERPQEVDLQIRRRPPREVAEADHLRVLGGVAALEAKQVPRCACAGVQDRAKPLIVGHEPQAERERRDDQWNRDRDGERTP